MDNAVALVRAYLHVNGYFTVTEHPVIEATEDGSYRSVTDLDMLAFRFPAAGRLVAGEGEDGALAHLEPDPELGVPAGRADMLVGEVKEGRAELNRGAVDNAVLRAALVRFGCCDPDHIESALGELRKTGDATLPGGHAARLVAFGSTVEDDPEQPYRKIRLGHVLDFLRAYLDEYWEVLRHSEFKDPAFGFLMTLEKADRDGG